MWEKRRKESRSKRKGNRKKGKIEERTGMRSVGKRRKDSREK